MRIIILFILVSLLIVISTGPAYCDGPTEKLSRGFSNLLTFPCEIPWQINETYKQNGIAAAWGYGLLKGVFMSGARAIVGLYEIITFAIPAPGAFEPILTDPEFFFKKN